jgi:hypothetical protein
LPPEVSPEDTVVQPPAEPEPSPSQKGELDLSGEPGPVEDTVVPETEPEPQVEPTTPEEPFLKVSDKTVYKNAEEATKGIAEKDKTIEERTAELEAAQREVESLKQRLDTESRQADYERETTSTAAAAKPEESAVAYDEVVAPEADKLYDIWDNPDQGGPMEVIKRGMEYHMQDLRPAIDFLKKLQTMKIDQEMAKLVDLNAADIITGFYADQIYNSIDARHPNLKGLWRDSSTPIGKEYDRSYQELDKSRTKALGYGLEQMAAASPEALDLVINDVIKNMDQGIVEQYLTKLNENTANGSPGETTPAPSDDSDKGAVEEEAPAGVSGITREEAEAIAEKKAIQAADIAATATREQGRLHGDSHMEGAGAHRQQPAAGEKVWTKDEIRKDPTGWKKSRMQDPRFKNLTLDNLPIGRA